MRRIIYYPIQGVLGFPKTSCFDQNCNITHIDQFETTWVNRNIWKWLILSFWGHNHIPRTGTRPSKPNWLIRGALANEKWDRGLFVSILDFCHITMNYFYFMAQMGHKNPYKTVNYHASLIDIKLKKCKHIQIITYKPMYNINHSP